MEDVIVREATAADAPFLLSVARDAYRDVLARQFGGWDDSIHGVRFAIHSMYANDIKVVGNRSTGNDMGYAFMYSRVRSG